MNSRRAFALPLVVILAAVLGTIVAYMLARQSTQQLTIERQINRYREHHNGRGMQELVDAFLKTVRERDAARFIAPDGKALDVDLPGGGLLSIYISDGQGAALDPTAAGGDREAAQAIYDQAPEGMPTRSFGTVQVSINSADRATLVAIAGVATKGTHGDDFASAVIAARSAKPIPPQDVDNVAQTAGFTPEQIQELRKYITAEPQLWLVEARLNPGNGPAFAGRRDQRTFNGYAVFGGPARAAGMGSVSQIWAKRSSLRDWKEVFNAPPRQETGR